MYVLDIDLGTSSCKAILVNQAGKIIKYSSLNYPLSVPRPLWSEQNPEDWLQAVISSIQDVTSGYASEDIKGIGLTGQMSGLVMLNSQGEVIYPAILWNDGRAQQECEIISNRFSNILKETGNYPVPGLVAPKLLWFQKCEPSLWEKVKTILLPKDYVRFKLTGEIISDISDSSLTQLMNVEERTWNPLILEMCGIDESYLGRLLKGMKLADMSHK